MHPAIPLASPLPFPWALSAVTAGNYISLWKVLPVVFVLLLWARLLTWVDKDAPAAHLPREGLNLGFVLGLAAAFAAFVFLPGFIFGFGAFLLVFLIEAGVYLMMRKSKVGLGDLKEQFAAWRKGLKKEKEVEVKAGQVVIQTPKGVAMPPPNPDDADRSGYDGVQELLTDPLVKAAERVDLAPSDGRMLVKYVVDGMPYNGPALDPNMGAAAITYLKVIAGLNTEERRKPQKGTFRAVLNAKRHEMDLLTSGSAAGEVLRVVVDPKKRHSLKLEELGFNADQLAAVKASIQAKTGVVLLAVPKAHGLTSLFYGVLRAHDAFLQHIHTVERAPDQDIEGITQNKLPANATAAEEVKQIDWVISQEPDILGLNVIEDPRSAVALAKFAGDGDGKRVYVCLRAGNTFEALNQWRKLVGDDKLAMKSLNLVVAGRVMRRLCLQCKTAFAPDPEALRKLGINPAKATQMFQARKEPMRDPKGLPIPCEFCHDLRYKGRFGVFEVLAVDDEVRDTIAGGASVNQLRAVVRKQKSKFLQEAAFEKVTEGETSVQEVRRVLEAGAESARPAPGAAAPAKGAQGAPRASSRGAARPPAQ